MLNAEKSQGTHEVNKTKLFKKVISELGTKFNYHGRCGTGRYIWQEVEAKSSIDHEAVRIFTIDWYRAALSREFPDHDISEFPEYYLSFSEIEMLIDYIKVESVYGPCK